jgi:hypothetical protein
MKLIIYLIGVLAMLATSGCVIREERYHRGGGYDHYYYDHGHGYSSPAPYPGNHYWEYRYRQY